MTSSAPPPYQTRSFLLAALLLLFPAFALASADSGHSLDLTRSTVGYTALAVFLLAYLLVKAEQLTH